MSLLNLLRARQENRTSKCMVRIANK